MLVLSLFPGIDILGLGFEMEGFTVVRGPDPMWGRLHDVRRFHPPGGVFEGVIGGPPCQPFSTLGKYAHTQKDDLIGEFARVVVEAAPHWFLMENVPGAPSPRVDGYAVHTFTLNLRHLDAGNGLGHIQHRKRRIWFGVRGGPVVDLRSFLSFAALEHPQFAPAVLASGQFRVSQRGHIPLRSKRGPSRSTVRESLRLQGLPEDFFAHSPFTIRGQQRLVGNAVPLPMARALAMAIKTWRQRFPISGHDKTGTEPLDRRYRGSPSASPLWRYA